MKTHFSSLKTILIVCALSLGVGGAYWLRPDRMLADELPPIALGKNIPAAFGDWKEEAVRGNQIVNPETQAVLDSLYSELLSRTYVNGKGQRVMLSIAYGRNQGDDKALHYPEVCYPAQGFRLVKNTKAPLALEGHAIPTKRIVAQLGARWEPITYWATVGNEVVLGSMQHKLAQLRYSLNGSIPDGMIFRVSTIGQDSDVQWAVQDTFLIELARAMNKEARPRFMGHT